MKKNLITGGAGFVGYHLAKRLAEKGEEVVIVDDFFRGRKDKYLEELLTRSNVTSIKADLTDKAAWETVGTGYDCVYHLAGINGTSLFYSMPEKVLRIGVLTVLNALEWFRSLNGKAGAKILYTSSNEAYGGALESFTQLPIPTPENVPLVVPDPYNPRWSYAGQKLIGELFFIHYAKAYGLRMSIVRPHNFYGPRAGYHHVIPEVIGRIQKRVESFPLYGADDTRSFCYIDDAVEAIERVMESSATDGNTYHIGTHEETIIRDLIEEIFILMDWRPGKIDLHHSLPGSVKRRLPDVSKIKRDVGWEAKIGLKEGLRRTIEWYKEHPNPPTDKML